jgi:hypothetical protein
VSTRGRLALLEAVWLAFAVLLGPFALPGGDARLPYDFLRKLVGEDVHARAYKYGLAYFEAPFYAVGKGLAALGVSTLVGQPIVPAVIALGIALYVGIAVALAAGLVRALDLPHSNLAAAAGLFGTALFFYGAFDPGETHAVDALLATVVAVLALRGFRTGWPTWTAVGLGTVVGVATSIRYFTGVSLVALVITLALQRRLRASVLAIVSAAIAFVVATLPPLLVGVSPLKSGYGSQFISWSPLSPPRMLFTDHRGLFVWTPAVALALIGLGRLVVVRRADRPFLVFLVLTALGTIASYALVSFWDAGFSFSNRYFTSLFPIVVVGLAGLFEWRPRIAPAAAVAAAVWSTYLGLALTAFLYFTAGTYSATSVARIPRHNSPGEFVTALASRAPVLRRLGFGG